MGENANREYAEVFIEATVKCPGETYLHEFDNPDDSIENLHIWDGARVQVLSKSNQKKNLLFYKQLTCAWFHPMHGLLIGNIKKCNLEFDNKIKHSKLYFWHRMEYPDRHRLGHSTTNGTPELPTEPTTSNQEFQISKQMLANIRFSTLSFSEKESAEKKKVLESDSIKKALKQMKLSTERLVTDPPDSEERKKTLGLFKKLRDKLKLGLHKPVDLVEPEAEPPLPKVAEPVSGHQSTTDTVMRPAPESQPGLTEAEPTPESSLLEVGALMAMAILAFLLMWRYKFFQLENGCRFPLGRP